MAYTISDKLVIAISSSVLFDLQESDQIFKTQGAQAYASYQEKHLDETLKPGVAFGFIKRLLNLNQLLNQKLVEVVLLSRNSPETGLRVMRSIEHYGLDISRAGFFSGASPFSYLPAFDTSLFLSSDEADVSQAIAHNYPAGLVMQSEFNNKFESQDSVLRLAFDFDGVIIDDEAEKIYKQSNDLDEFHAHEVRLSNSPHNPGVLKKLLDKLCHIQAVEKQKQLDDPEYTKVMELALITARGAPSHERVVTTLKNWGLTIDRTFFLGGIDKSRILEIMQPHIYFDDQRTHLDQSLQNISLVHIPFGIANN